MKPFNPRHWDTPTLRAALASPTCRQPLVSEDADFEADERDYIDRRQAADLRRRDRDLLDDLEYGILYGPVQIPDTDEES